MTDLSLENPTATNLWSVDLTEYSEVEKALPLNFCNVTNGSALVLVIFLEGKRVGKIQPFSSDTYSGRDFTIFRVETKDGDDFAIEDIFVQVGKDVAFTATPYNPAFEMLEEDLDSYASGCNGRISYSSTISSELVKHWINIQNGLLVQRRLDIAGTAAMGSYEITFDSNTKVNGAVPINGVVLDTKRYKKILTDYTFDYSVTNCTIAGWMIDYKKNTDDLSVNYTVLTGGADAPIAYDDDILTSVYYGQSGATQTEKWKVDLGEIKNITNMFFYTQIKSNFANHDGYCKWQISDDNSAWTTIATQTVHGDVYQEQIDADDTDRTCRYIRALVYSNTAGVTGQVKIYDVSVFD